IQRAVADPGAGAQLGHALAQLVAVPVVLPEQAQEGQFDHRGSMYRADASDATNGDERWARSASVGTAVAPPWSPSAANRMRPRVGPGVATLMAVSFSPGAIRGAPAGTPGEIDYRLARQALISEYRKGRLAQHEVCDAHPELVRAARECSEPSPR